MEEGLESTRVGSRASAEMARARVGEGRGDEAAWARREKRAGHARPRLMFFVSFVFLLSFMILSFCQAVRGAGERVAPV